MGHSAIFTLVVFMVVTLGVIARGWTQMEQGAAPSGTQTSPAGRVSVVEQDVWIVFAEEPSQHFHQARADFWKKDMIGAATEILKGAAYLKLAADTAGGESKDALMASVRALDLLAYNIQMEGTIYITDFDQQFAQAEAAMADYFLRRAKEAWSKKDAKSTGINLRIATITLENAWGWTGEKPEPQTITVVKETHEFASQMVGGTGWTEDQVTVEVDKVSAEIDKIKKKTAKKAS